jgi:hypothetical protein
LPADIPAPVTLRECPQLGVSRSVALHLCIDAKLLIFALEMAGSGGRPGVFHDYQTTYRCADAAMRFSTQRCKQGITCRFNFQIIYDMNLIVVQRLGIKQVISSIY